MGRRDKEQRQRRSQQFGLSIACICLLGPGLNSIGKIQAGESGFGILAFALMVAVMAWLVLALIHGWDGGSRKARKYLEDEWTRVLRASAVTWGYVALLAGASVVYGISLWRPEWTSFVLALALAAGGAVPALRFAMMDKAVDGDDA